MENSTIKQTLTTRELGELSKFFIRHLKIEKLNVTILTICFFI
ncbi:hypothetical protein L580_0733 [Serratia fonticola AU-P3(3)]|nr:hypothetical protein L580_0733 [Serratia fonticola AU-P3(3)]